MLKLSAKGVVLILFDPFHLLLGDSHVSVCTEMEKLMSVQAMLMKFLS